MPHGIAWDALHPKADFLLEVFFESSILYKTIYERAESPETIFQFSIPKKVEINDLKIHGFILVQYIYCNGFPDTNRYSMTEFLSEKRVSPTDSTRIILVTRIQAN